MKKTKIIVVDDHAVVRMGFVALLESEPDLAVIGEAGDGRSAVELAQKTRPDVILMDLLMPQMNGAQATAAVKAFDPSIKILILTSSSDVEEIGRALDAQADGILLKSDNYTDVVKAIRTLAAGHKSISPLVQKMLAERPSPTTLSDRQMEVLSAMCRGLTNADIAKMLGISPDGVKFHITAILAKLGAANRSEAVAIALQNRLLRT
jgi:DNA-binding NarL/FixJ family response regulator